jgi:hypothetical protein
MTSTPNFDEKKFWIVLFSIVARREAVREQVIERADEPQSSRNDGIGGCALVRESLRSPDARETALLQKPV